MSKSATVPRARRVCSVPCTPLATAPCSPLATVPAAVRPLAIAAVLLVLLGDPQPDRCARPRDSPGLDSRTAYTVLPPQGVRELSVTGAPTTANHYPASSRTSRLPVPLPVLLHQPFRKCRFRINELHTEGRFG